MTTTAPEPGAWPLSAATTAMLRDPGLSAAEVVKLALRELAARGVLSIEKVEPRSFRPPRVTLLPGGRPAAGLPVPLPELAAALLPHTAAEGTEAADVVRKAVAARRDLLVLLHAQTREELASRGLVDPQRYRLLGVIPRTRWIRTPSGEAWAAVPRDLELGRAAAGAAGAALPAVGFLLALDQAVARALRPQGDAQPVVWAGDTSGSTDHPPDRDTLDAVLGDAGAGLDGAVDGGSGAGGGDGGDGGGGGGD